MFVCYFNHDFNRIAASKIAIDDVTN